MSQSKALFRELSKLSRHLDTPVSPALKELKLTEKPNVRTKVE